MATTSSDLPLCFLPVQDTLNPWLESGQALAAAEFARRLSWSPEQLDKAVRANRVFCVDGLGERYYPAFYADRRYQRAHLEAVAKLLGDLPGGADLPGFFGPKITGKMALRQRGAHEEEPI
jgi:hypothetical protein